MEYILQKVFNRVPGVVEARVNDGWGTDYGADLIVVLGTQMGNLELDHTVVVQVKSYVGEHSDLTAVRQIETAIRQYDADAGMIITTAKKTEQLENAVQELAEELGRPNDLIAGEDVARFVLKYASELLFNL